jgi:hypothetical protein
MIVIVVSLLFSLQRELTLHSIVLFLSFTAAEAALFLLLTEVVEKISQ